MQSNRTPVIIPGIVTPAILSPRIVGVRIVKCDTSVQIPAFLNFVLFFYGAWRQWRRDNIALITTLPMLDCLNLVQHLQPRRLEDMFLPLQTRKKSTAKSSVTSAHLPALLRLPCSVHLLAKDDSLALSLRAPRLQLPGNSSRHCAQPPHHKKLCRPILTRHHFQHALLPRDAQAKEQTRAKHL